MSECLFPKVYYGGDYNPDQWPEEIWQEDMKLFKEAGINIVTVPVFSWAKLQPSEDVYEFGWLDRVLNLVHENGINVCLATSTAAQPAWMSRKYPEMLPVDFEGRRRKHGGRVNFCPNSEVFRKFSGRLAGKLAERYHDHPALAVWHVGNEYGTYCYCETCEKAFREWLKARYGTLEELNRRWNMSFWGHTLYDWDEITAPSALNEMWKDGDRERSCFQGISLDYKRFMSESSMNCYINEYNAIRRYSADKPITTNLMGFFKPLDYFRWAEHMDVVSWDNYPWPGMPASAIALSHDLMRGLRGGQPFMLMEQTPSQTNWQPYNLLKRPGVMRLLSYQAMAHGADTVMFFQLRRSIGACEKFHSAVIDHCGHGNTRVFRECAELGAELPKLSDIVGSRILSRAAIMFDWENWWAVELSSGPTIQLKYVDQIAKYYKAFYDRNIPVDVIRPDADLSGYDIVVAPVLYMVRDGVAASIERFVQNGGTFVTTFLSGLVDENDLVVTGGYPGELRKVLGIWVEEFDGLQPEMRNRFDFEEKTGAMLGCYECGLICEVINLEGAESLANFGRDFYAGRPAVTVNRFGKGKAYYVATDTEDRFIKDLVRTLCDEKGIMPAYEAARGIEITQRSKGARVFTFVLNNRDDEAGVNLGDERHVDMLSGKELTGSVALKPKDVLILEKIG
jgi:beta-galactosidase